MEIKRHHAIIGGALLLLQLCADIDQISPLLHAVLGVIA